MMNSIYISIICIFSLALSGCGQGASQIKQVAKQVSPDPAFAKLAEAANASSRSMLSLAEIELAVSPPPPDYHPIDLAGYGMSNLVSIDWSGPIQPIVQRIANATGYQLKTFGIEPAVPILVYVNVKNKPIGDILRDIGYQCHTKASLVVYPETQVIELRYAET
jgi:defect in organelle trafficking protein DotD